MRLTRPADLEELRVGEELYCFSPSSGQLMVISGVAATVWDCCSGEVSVDLLVDRVAARLEQDRNSVSVAVTEIVASFLHGGFISMIRPPGPAGSPT